MGLMSRIHGYLLRRGRLSDLLPEVVDPPNSDRPEREVVRDEIQARAISEREISKEVAAAIVRLRELDKKNHYGESLRRAFGGQ